ncbi:MAG: MFS transporter [Alphaproteobacteria bacterium]|nr:MFS transporter [Alphaproteobacteria bacterium]
MEVRKSSYLTILICGSLVLTVMMGLRQTLGLFLKPMTIELGVGREVFALGAAVSNLLWGLAGPFAGAIADKFGTSRAVVLGGLLYAAGFWSLSAATDGTLILVGNVLQGFAMAGAGFSIILGAVGRAAPPEKRSLALGIVAAGGSFGQFACVPFGQILLDMVGWREALVGIAVSAVSIAPLALGLRGLAAPASAQSKQTLGEALREALGHSGFWLLTIGFFVCGFQVVFVGVHLPAYVADKGLPGWVGAWGLALVGLFNIIGTYVAGMLGQTKRKKYLLAGIYIGRSFVFIIFLMTPISEASVLVFTAALGLLWLSTVPLTSGLVAQIFGTTYMSTLYGIVFFSHQIGSFLGAWLGGKVYDVYGSYDVVWKLCVLLGFVAAALHWPLRDAPQPRLAAAAGD